MRKIVSKKVADKSSRNKQLFVGLILIVLMLVSTLGYAFNRGDSTSATTKVVYNGFTFYNQNGYWITQIGSNQFWFVNNPNEVPSIGGEVNPISSYSGQPLYIASNNTIATNEIYTNLGNIALRVSYACLKGEDCGGDFPIKTCDDNLIVIREGNVSTIVQENNCVYIVSPAENITRVTDEFLFKTIGIDK